MEPAYSTLASQRMLPDANCDNDHSRVMSAALLARQPAAAPGVSSWWNRLRSMASCSFRPQPESLRPRPGPWRSAQCLLPPWRSARPRPPHVPEAEGGQQDAHDRDRQGCDCHTIVLALRQHTVSDGAGLPVQDLPGRRHPGVPDQRASQLRRLGRERSSSSAPAMLAGVSVALRPYGKRRRRNC